MNRDEEMKQLYRRLACDLEAAKGLLDDPEPAQSTDESRHQWLEKTGRFAEMKHVDTYRSDAQTSKMWIFPDGHVVSLDRWHYYWILDNGPRVARYGLDIATLPKEENPVRHAALQAGMFRVNYDHKSGRLIVEGIKSKYNREIGDAIFMILFRNKNAVNRAFLTLFDDSITEVLEHRDPRKA
jgi:hypothetical protein